MSKELNPTLPDQRPDDFMEDINTGPLSASAKPDLHYTTYDVQINNFLLGEVLTIIDAAIIDERQCKAIKDLIKGQFRRKANYLADLSRDRNTYEYKSAPVDPTNIEIDPNVMLTAK